MEKWLSYEVRKPGRNLRTVECALHQNELPFRSLFKKLDGAKTGPQNFSMDHWKAMQNELPQLIHCAI